MMHSRTALWISLVSLVLAQQPPELPGGYWRQDRHDHTQIGLEIAASRAMHLHWNGATRDLNSRILSGHYRVVTPGQIVFSLEHIHTMGYARGYPSSDWWGLKEGDFVTCAAHCEGDHFTLSAPDRGFPTLEFNRRDTL